MPMPMLMRRSLVLLAALLAGGPGGGALVPLVAQNASLAHGSAGLGLLLRRLDGVKRVLVIGAHPDDEDTSLLSALSRGMGVETAYLSLSRGEGGQNLLGNELDEGLGLLRTGELLAARNLDGGRQYFTRAFDFGFSKTAEETFRYWPREEILADVTWVVRTFRPQIIVSVFSGTPRDGHGQHQVAGMVAQAAFEAAGDPSAFPEQLRAGAVLWAPSKLYGRSRSGPGDGSTEVETGRFDPLLGRSHHQLAMESRSQHRSQDMGMPQPLGPRSSRLSLISSRVGSGDEEGDTFFTGVDTTLLGLAAGAEGERRAEVEAGLQAYGAAIAAARNRLDAMAPWVTTPHLEAGLEALRRVREALDVSRDPELRRVIEERIPLLEEALLLSEGIIVDARVEDDLLVPGEEVGVVVEVWNGGPENIHGVSAALELPGGWVARPKEGEDGVNIPPGALTRWRFDLQVPEDAQISRPYFMESPRDGEIYRWPDTPSLWGKPGNPDPIHARVRLQVGDTTAVAVLRTAVYRGVDKATGEYEEPVLLVPAFSVSMDPVEMVWPSGLTDSRDFTVRVVNQGPTGGTGVVTLDLPQGWSAEPESYSLHLGEPGEEASFSFRVAPPRSLTPGEYLVGAEVSVPGGRVYREGFALVDYPHIMRSALFSPATARVSAVPVSLEPGLRVGYIMGSGDLGAEVLGQMGASVTMLGPEALRNGAFGELDVLVLGIRAYETRPDLVAANRHVLDFARAGGTVVVQYNKYEYPQGGFAPYPVSISRPHDRVADETVPVTILDPDHPFFNYPNRITEADFEGWAQERGLYFLGEWDDRYTPLLEMADPGEDAKRGGLVVAPLGEGLYVYTGLAFFRQFPEGIPGAYRLFANLVSLKGESAGGE
jgi:LmbE family N-acetylglucosaminyl deacetylase